MPTFPIRFATDRNETAIGVFRLQPLQSGRLIDVREEERRCMRENFRRCTNIDTASCHGIDIIKGALRKKCGGSDPLAWGQPSPLTSQVD
jgi:hypothetical protein